MDLQVLASQWVGQIAEFLHLGYGVGAGMVSAVNPCGFSMLPIYLTLYLGANEEAFASKSIVIRILQAVWVTLVVTSGFGLLFLLCGSIILLGGNFIQVYIPWFAVCIGILLVFLGVWLLMGKYLSFPFLLNWAQKIGDPRKIGLWSFFLFGVGFGITSMSCTLPIFLAVVGSSITQGDFQQGVMQYFAYISGVALVLLSLTLAIAFVKEGKVVGGMRKLLPYVHKISAVFLLIAGIYIIYYWLTSGLV